MDSHILRKAANRLPALADIAVFRFNTRGTASDHGRSQGEFGDGQAERYDVAAAIAWCERAGLPRQVAGRLVVRHRAGADVGRGSSRGRGHPALARPAPGG